MRALDADAPLSASMFFGEFARRDAQSNEWDADESKHNSIRVYPS